MDSKERKTIENAKREVIKAYDNLRERVYEYNHMNISNTIEERLYSIDKALDIVENELINIVKEK